MPRAHPSLAAHHDAVERLGAALHASGIQRLPARVFAALMLDEDGRMTAAELGESLVVSPASVSGAVRYLQTIRLVQRERERGSRRDVFVVQDDAWHDLFMERDQLYAPIMQALRDAEPVVGEASRPGRRVALSLDFLEFVQSEMEGMAQRWEDRKRAAEG